MEDVSLGPFAKSVAALRRALEFYEEHRTGPFVLPGRNSLILEFSICFGQIRRVLERCLAELNGMDAGFVEEMSYATLMRTANQKGYTDVEWESWKSFRDARNETAHAYSEPAAEKIAAGVPFFLQTVQALLSNMQRKQQEARDAGS